MKKIPTVLVRDPENMRTVLMEITPGCEWVTDGQGKATRKYDGTCVMLGEDGRWWARREVKAGKEPPAGFMESEHDKVTGKRVGYEPVEQSGFAKWHAVALAARKESQFASVWPLEPGTYELCGPKVNGNPEGYEDHVLVEHAHAEGLIDPFFGPTPRTPEELVEFARWCGEQGYEGIVWHHPDGRMAKLKARDVVAFNQQEPS